MLSCKAAVSRQFNEGTVIAFAEPVYGFGETPAG